MALSNLRTITCDVEKDDRMPWPRGTLVVKLRGTLDDLLHHGEASAQGIACAAHFDGFGRGKQYDARPYGVGVYEQTFLFFERDGPPRRTAHNCPDCTHTA